MGVGPTVQAVVVDKFLFNPLKINIVLPRTFKVLNMGEVQGSVCLVDTNEYYVLECPERIQRLIADATKDRTTYNLSFQPT